MEECTDVLSGILIPLCKGETQLRFLLHVEVAFNRQQHTATVERTIYRILHCESMDYKVQVEEKINFLKKYFKRYYHENTDCCVGCVSDAYCAEDDKQDIELFRYILCGRETIGDILKINSEINQQAELKGIFENCLNDTCLSNQDYTTTTDESVRQ